MGTPPARDREGALSVASLVAARAWAGDDVENLAENLAENPNATVRRSNCSLAGAAVAALDRLASRAEDVPADVAVRVPRTVSERVERKAAYVATGEAVSLWQDTVKANRERPTLKFTDAERRRRDSTNQTRG